MQQTGDEVSDTVLSSTRISADVGDLFDASKENRDDICGISATVESIGERDCQPEVRSGQTGRILEKG